MGALRVLIVLTRTGKLVLNSEDTICGMNVIGDGLPLGGMIRITVYPIYYYSGMITRGRNIQYTYAHAFCVFFPLQV